MLALPLDVQEGHAEEVVHWLHGLNSTPAAADPVVARLDAGVKAGTGPEMIRVSCRGLTKHSMWTDSKNGTLPVKTVIVKDLIEHVNAT